MEFNGSAWGRFVGMEHHLIASVEGGALWQRLPVAGLCEDVLGRFRCSMRSATNCGDWVVV